jgi:hypothetical protein
MSWLRVASSVAPTKKKNRRTWRFWKVRLSVAPKGTARARSLTAAMDAPTGSTPTQPNTARATATAPTAATSACSLSGL